MDGSTAPKPEKSSSVVESSFCYEEAFSRNLGWLTEWEQQALRGKCVAIAGMGGVGGSHLLTLARLGIGAFRIADLDRFELANFNRQTGATIDTLNRPKVDVMAEKARQINPELQITCFDHGVDENNLDEFLSGADLYVDSLDFFVLGLRRRVTARCRELGIPVINAAPLGMGTAFLIFTPEGMSFEEWFHLDGLSEEHQYVSYLLGMAPSGLHRSYLVDPSRVDLRGHRGPSTVAACELCAGVAGVEAVKLLLGRGKVKAAPYYHHFDAYRGQWVTKKLRRGNRSLRQRLKIAVMKRLAARWSQMTTLHEEAGHARSEIEKILDLARWAPSGDNNQPWRFDLTGEDEFTLFLNDQSDHDLYDYRGGEPTLLSGGMLIESIGIAATRWGRRLEWRYEGRQGNKHELRVSLQKAVGISTDRQLSLVPLRSVDRRNYRLRPLTTGQKHLLTASIGSKLTVNWHETLGDRWRLARLGGRATIVRLSAPETFPIHQRVIDWDHALSPNGIPAGAAGLSRSSLWLMRWAMKTWSRMRLLNRLGGTITGAVQMDYLPGLFGAGYFSLRMRDIPEDPLEKSVALIEAGRSIQRFWLTATGLGLAMQPNMATLIFAHYGENDPAFTSDPRTRRHAATLARMAHDELDTGPSLIFLGRIGTPPARFKRHRSIRRPLPDLMTTAEDNNTPAGL